MTRRTVILSVIVLCLLALLLRAGYVINAQAWQQPNAMEHDTIAQSILDGNGFSFGDWHWYGKTSVQSPPYPWILTASFWMFGERNSITGEFTDLSAGYAAAMMLNCLAGALTVWLVYLLVRALGGNEIMGLIAAGLCAIWPTQIYSCSVAQAISLITLCMTAMILLFQRSVETGKIGPWIGFSIIGTLAALTEPVLLPAMALTGLIILLWRSLPMNIRIRNAVILFVAALAIIGPWSVRNRLVHGRWVPIKNTFWVNVWKGNNDNATGTDRLAITDEVKSVAEQSLTKMTDEELRDSKLDSARQYDKLSEEQKNRLWGRPEMVREDAFKDFATTWIKAHPAGYAKLCLIRLGKTLWIDGDNPKSYKLIYVISRGILQTLTVLGIFFALRNRWAFFFPILLLATCLLTYTLTVTAARFSIPFEPLQIAWASAFLGSCLPKSNTESAPGFQPSLKSS